MVAALLRTFDSLARNLVEIVSSFQKKMCYVTHLSKQRRRCCTEQPAARTCFVQQLVHPFVLTLEACTHALPAALCSSFSPIYIMESTCLRNEAAVWFQAIYAVRCYTRNKLRARTSFVKQRVYPVVPTNRTCTHALPAARCSSSVIYVHHENHLEVINSRYLVENKSKTQKKREKNKSYRYTVPGMYVFYLTLVKSALCRSLTATGGRVSNP